MMSKGKYWILALWFDAMMNATWGDSLTIAPISLVYY